MNLSTIAPAGSATQFVFEGSDMVTTRDASPTPQASRKPKPRKFFEMYYQMGQGSWELDIENERNLVLPGRALMGRADGQRGFTEFPETPRVVIHKKRKAEPRDLNPCPPYWLISDRMKSVLEAVDPAGFAFAACAARFRDGTPAPVYWLCDVIRVLDALDEENSTVTIRHERDGKKYYPIGKGIAFKENVVGAAHIFLVQHHWTSRFCDEVLREACKAAGLRGIKFRDVAEL